MTTVYESDVVRAIRDVRDKETVAWARRMRDES